MAVLILGANSTQDVRPSAWAPQVQLALTGERAEGHEWVEDTVSTLILFQGQHGNGASQHGMAVLQCQGLLETGIFVFPNQLSIRLS